MNAFFTTVAIIAIVSIPFVIELYLGAGNSKPADDEYVPDGR